MLLEAYSSKSMQLSSVFFLTFLYFNVACKREKVHMKLRRISVFYHKHIEFAGKCKNNKESKSYKRLLFVQLMMNMLNLGSKENWGVKSNDKICAKLCLKLWFESDWYFCIITESGWFWKWLSRNKVPDSRINLKI